MTDKLNIYLEEMEQFRTFLKSKASDRALNLLHQIEENAKINEVNLSKASKWPFVEKTLCLINLLRSTNYDFKSIDDFNAMAYLDTQSMKYKTYLIDNPILTWDYSLPNHSSWTSFDFGQVKARNKEQAKAKAIEMLTEDFNKVNEVLESADVTQGYQLEWNPNSLEITLADI
jgi:hypothetical protein